MVVALDQLGGMLSALEIATNRAGFRQLLVWASELGVIDRVGIEGTGPSGAGLFRWLRARGISVVEVDRPDRKLRRQRGKDDLTDAEGVAGVRNRSGSTTVAERGSEDETASGADLRQVATPQVLSLY